MPDPPANPPPTGNDATRPTNMISTFRPPEHFNFTKPAEWPTWKRSFERFRSCSRLNAQTETMQVDSLLYAMGSQAEAIFDQLNLTAAQAVSYKDVMEKFDQYFAPKHNVIFERAQLSKRVQNENEPVEDFITSLYAMAERCGFSATVKSEVIRDRIVSGIRDTQLSKEMQLKADLTLDNAIEMARQHQLITSQMAKLTVNAAANIDETKHRKPRYRKPRSKPPQPSHHQTKCMRCGYSHNRKKVCAAASATCNYCRKIGHYESVCRRKNTPKRNETHEVLAGQHTSYAYDAPYEPPPPPSNTQFLGEVNAPLQVDDRARYTTVTINGEDVRFKIDTGADVSVISTSQYHRLAKPPTLQPPNISLSTYGSNPKAIGMFEAKTCVPFWVYVVDGNGSNLLSRGISVAMGLIAFNETKCVYELKTIKCNPVKITLKDDAIPYHVNIARNVPAPLETKVEEKLKQMEEDGIISRVTEPTDWCAPMVVVLKKTGDVRICVDLKGLNKHIKRERFMLPTFEEIAPKLAGSSVFSKLDAASGYWQLPLDPSSAKLTTFIAPGARYCFQRLPFGICSASEIYQREVSRILEGVKGVVSYQDDLIVHGRDQAEHDRRLALVLQRLEVAGLTLNQEKCEYSKPSVTFLGHIISKDGTSPDPDKTKAIREMPPPTKVSELRTILGMIQYLGKYVPNLSDILRPMNELLRDDTAWNWTHKQQESLDKVKSLITKAPTLAFFDPTRETVVSADASNYGIGGFLMQKHGDDLKPIAFCSRTMTDAEKRYGVTEKECLASTWACDRLQHYLTGLPTFRLITDHLPLVPLVNSKDISKAPPRCQRLLLRLMRFNAVAEHHPGKTMHVSDALSRSPLQIDDITSVRSLQEDVDAFIDMVEISFPATEAKLDLIREETDRDEILQQVIHYTLNGWPTKTSSIRPNLHAYHAERSQLSVANRLLLYRDRVVIPPCMRPEILDRIHDGHWGMAKCISRASESIWWPGFRAAIIEKVSKCMECTVNHAKQRNQPLCPSPLPQYPWQKIGVDLFEHNRRHFLIQIDYYSRFIEISHMTTTTTAAVVAKIQNSASRFGIPQEIVSDGGPQFSSGEFAQFGKDLGFVHRMTSPHFPQANGEAESAVKIAKKIVSQDNPFRALLAYHATPTSSTKISPAEAMFNRKIHTTLPCLPEKLQPQEINKDRVLQNDSAYKVQMAQNYNRKHGVRDLEPFKPGEQVQIRTDKEPNWKKTGTVTEQVTPRSYIVEAENGKSYRRNRKHLARTPQNDEPNVEVPERRNLIESFAPPNNGEQSTTNPAIKTSRAGRILKPVDRLDL